MSHVIFYTLLAGYRPQNLEQEDYLVEVFKRIPRDATPDQAAALTPDHVVAEQKLAGEQTGLTPPRLSPTEPDATG